MGARDGADGTFQQTGIEVLGVVDGIAVGHVQLVGIDALGRKFLDERHGLIEGDHQRGIRIRGLDAGHHRGEVRFGRIEGILLAINDLHAGILHGFDDHVTQGRAVFIVEDRDGKVLHTVLCDDLAQHGTLYGVRRDGAEEVVVQAGECGGRGTRRDHRHLRGRDLLVGVLDHGAGRRADHDGRVLGEHRLRRRRVLVGMVRVRSVGRSDFDVFAEYAAGIVDVLLRKLHGGDIGRAEVRHGAGEREQACRHERAGIGCG